MSFTNVQSTGIASTVTVASQPITVTLTAGHTVIIIATGFTGVNFTNPVLTISDSNSNSWINDITGPPGGTHPAMQARTAIFRSRITTGGSTTITVFASINSFITFSLDEYASTGIAMLDSTGTSASIDGIGNVASTSSMSVTVGALLVAGWNLRTTGLTYVAGSGFTLGYTQNGASSISLVSEYTLNQTSTPINPTATLSGSASWGGVSASYIDIIPTIIGTDGATSTNSNSFMMKRQSDSWFASESSLELMSFADAAIWSEANSLAKMPNVDQSIGFDSRFLSCVTLNVDQVSGSQASYKSSLIFNHDSASDNECNMIFYLYSFSDSASSADVNLQASSLISMDSCVSLDFNYLTSSLISLDQVSSSEYQVISLLPLNLNISKSDSTVASESDIKIYLSMETAYYNELQYLLSFIYTTDFGNSQDF